MVGGTDRAAKSDAGIGGCSGCAHAWACDTELDGGRVTGNSDPVHSEYGSDVDRVYDRYSGRAVLGKEGYKDNQ